MSEFVGLWVAGAKLLRGLHGLRGLKYFLRDQHFMWVIIFTWVVWVKIFLHGSIFFPWFKIFRVSQNFLQGLNFGVSLFWGVGLNKS